MSGILFFHRLQLVLIPKDLSNLMTVSNIIMTVSFSIILGVKVFMRKKLLAETSYKRYDRILSVPIFPIVCPFAFTLVYFN